MAYAFNIEIVLTNKGKPGILFDDLDLERTKIQKLLFYVQKKKLWPQV